MLKGDWTGLDLLRLSGAYWQSCAVHAAVQLDIFTLLGQNPLNDQELAEKLGCPVRGLSMLITALASLGLVRRVRGRTSPVAGALRYLSRSSPDYLGFIIRHHANVMPGWTRLAETVRSGLNQSGAEIFFTEEEEEREAFLLGMHNVASLQAESVAEALNLSGRKKLLDAGGGPGSYAVYFCKKNPQLTATILDLPSSERFARKVIADFGLEGRVDFLGGDLLRDPLPAGHDVVWISQVLHGLSPAAAATLVAAAAAALEPGGLFCVQEFLLRDSRTGPAGAALFSLNMLTQTKDGQAYTEKEISGMLSAAGILRPRLLDEKFPGGARVLLGEKKAGSKTQGCGFDPEKA
ncbi:MAG: methyltransferase domain-containing protein [Deltaproteobacteria bacterium]|jgi:predicted O-methyltransferase YrrM|nr:methyltransferase domain-containing protein [Deltaproteobacteria bacterium]